MAVERQEAPLGRKLTKQEVAHVVHQSRPKKFKGASDDQVRRQQLGEIGFFEKRALRKVVEAANGQSKDFARSVTMREAVDHGIAHVFERTSVAPQHKILEAALVNGCGQLDLPLLKNALAERSELVRVGSEFSTRDILTKELSLIRTVNAGIDGCRPDHQPLRTGRLISARTSARRWPMFSPAPTGSPAFAAWPVPAKARLWSN